MTNQELKNTLLKEKDELLVKIPRLQSDLAAAETRLETVLLAIDAVNQVINAESNLANVLNNTDTIDIMLTKLPTIDENCKEKLSKIYIENVFIGGMYNRFLQYCLQDAQVKLYTMDKLADFNFKSLSKINGIGENKIKKIIEKYIETVSAVKNGTYTNSNTTNTNIGSVELFTNIHASIINEDIDYLSIFDIKSSTINKLKDAKIYKLHDLLNITKPQLSRMLSKQLIMSLCSISSNLTKSANQNLYEYLDNSTNEKGYNICKLRSAGKTLQEIADDYNVSRERIRQLEEVYVSKLNIAVNAVFKQLLNNTDFIKVEDIKKYIKFTCKSINIYEYCRIIIYYAKLSELVEYLDFANLFIIKTNKDVSTYITNTVLSMVNDEICISSQMRFIIKKLWTEGYTYITTDAITNILIANDYIKYGDYLFKNKPSYAILCSKIISDRFPKGFKKEPNDFNILRKEFKKEFGYDLSESDKVIGARLDDYLILCDRGKLTTAEHVHVDDDLMTEIKTFIDNYPETTLRYSEIFEVFRNKLTQLSNIDNYHFLHGVIKYYYPNDYIYNSKDYFDKK